MKAEDTFILDNFEGPVDFLLYLIQRNEIDIYDIPLHKIMEQYLPTTVDTGAEFISIAATLHWLKSKMLLPKHEQLQNAEGEEIDPRFEIIHQLIEYCRFKEAAKELALREQQQNAYYFRGADSPETKKNLGIEHLTLDDLASLFKQIMAKSGLNKGLIHEEEWKVSDKIKSIRQLLKEHKKMDFDVLFNPELSRAELIVTFLALLELMKMGDVCVVLQNGIVTIMLVYG